MRWPITPEDRKLIVETMVAIVEDESASKRDRNAAFNVLLMADRMNQQDELKRSTNKPKIGFCRSTTAWGSRQKASDSGFDQFRDLFDFRTLDNLW